MNTPLEANTEENQVQTRKRTKRKVSLWIYFLLVVFWILLIGAGLEGAKYYTENLKTQMERDISQQISVQTSAQLKTVQQDYQKQINDMKSNFTADISTLQKKIDTFNQLLTFMKDSANSKTDNSNQLYTQIAEVRKQLDDLKKNLDVLK